MPAGSGYCSNQAQLIIHENTFQMIRVLLMFPEHDVQLTIIDIGLIPAGKTAQVDFIQIGSPYGFGMVLGMKKIIGCFISHHDGHFYLRCSRPCKSRASERAD